MNQQTLVPYKAITKLFILKPAGAKPAGTPSKFQVSSMDEAFLFLSVTALNCQLMIIPKMILCVLHD